MFNEIKQLPLSEWPARLSDMSVRGEMIAQAEELVNEDSMQGRLVRSMFGVNTVTSANDSSFKRPDMDMMTYYYPIVGTASQSHPLRLLPRSLKEALPHRGLGLRAAAGAEHRRARQRRRQVPLRDLLRPHDVRGVHRHHLARHPERRPRKLSPLSFFDRACRLANLNASI